MTPVCESQAVLGRRPTVLSLFSGVGGFDLGLERAGMEVVGQCDNDPFCQKVLAARWPEVVRFTDVRDVTADAVEEALSGASGRSREALRRGRVTTAPVSYREDKEGLEIADGASKGGDAKGSQRRIDLIVGGFP